MFIVLIGRLLVGGLRAAVVDSRLVSILWGPLSFLSMVLSRDTAAPPSGDDNIEELLV